MTRLVKTSPNQHMVNRWSNDKEGESKNVNRHDCLVRNEARSGALGGIRTPDTWFRRPVLYPLSYERLNVSSLPDETLAKGRQGYYRRVPAGGTAPRCQSPT